MLVAAPSVRTAEAPPSEESVRKLLSLTRWRESFELSLQNIDVSVQASLRQIIQTQDEKAFAAKTAEIAAKIKQELTPEKVEPIYIDAYRKNLTQREVDDMIAFYSSEGGKSVVAKMPLI